MTTSATDFLSHAMSLAMHFHEKALPMWIIMAAVILLLLLVMFQTVIEARKHRPSKLQEAARRQADEIQQQAQQQAEAIRNGAQLDAQRIRDDATHQAESVLKEARLQAKEAVINAKDEFEASMAERQKNIQSMEQRLAQKEDNVEAKLEELQTSLRELDRRDNDNRAMMEQLQQQRNEITQMRHREEAELLRISGLTDEQARQEVLERLENAMSAERGQLIRRFQEETRRQLVVEGQQILVGAMQRYAGECAYDRTTATVPLPNEEMKGRIIGREGRNIRTIEAATGASILIDDTPQAVVVSCFDPVRREIARQTMEKLVTDGRIHPSRVEEVVERTRKDVEGAIQKAGQEALERLGIRNVRPNLVGLLGRLQYRTSYSQNVLAHSIEVATMMGGIAAEIGLDEQLARRAGLFHDIGKAVDHEVEGSHAAIGADLLRRAGENEQVINAVAAHHEEVEGTSLLAALVQICDTVSAGRPGARCETTELYLKRLEDLERIGNSFAGVESCFAVQAGRELRVIVSPDAVDENAAGVLAMEMANRIEREMRYPGQIRVSVIRETRAVEYAK